MSFTSVVDAALDRSVVLGYTKIGSGLRRRWWPADAPPDALAGKHVVVTGATSGLGAAMAASFADLGAVVHLLGRNPTKVKNSADAIRRDVPDAVVVEETCDVSDLDAVAAWSDDLAGRVDALHGLVHNAGAMPKERIETPQGHETQLACHVLGPHLMTERLLVPLRNAGGSQVVFVSSGGMYTAPLDTDDLEFERGRYDGVRAYARTKRMQVVLANAWAERLADERSREDPATAADIRVASMHPGWAETPGVTESLPLFDKVMRPLLRDASDGADTAVWLVATRPPSRPPHFWHDRAQRPSTFGWQRAHEQGDVARLLDEVSAKTHTSRHWLALSD